MPENSSYNVVLYDRRRQITNTIFWKTGRIDKLYTNREKFIKLCNKKIRGCGRKQEMEYNKRNRYHNLLGGKSCRIRGI